MTTHLQSSFRRIQWLLLLATGPLCPQMQAQDVNEKWNVRYDGTTDGVHQGRAIAIDTAGDVVVAGASTGTNGYDFYIVKYAAATGAILWSDRYDGTGDGDDIPYAVAIDAVGDVIVTGSSVGPGSGPDVYTRKYNGATGADRWNQRDDGPVDGDDAATAVALDPAGNVIVTGHSAGSGSGLDFYTAKYAAASGSRLWFRRYNGPGNDEDGAAGVAVDTVGNVVVTGFSEGSSSRDFYTAKYDGATDAVLWDERYDGPGGGVDEAAAVALDAAGNVIVTGTSANNGNLDFYTIKYAAADGAELWSNRQNGSGNGVDRANAVAVDAAGNAFVTGTSSNGRNTDLIVAKYAAADGAELWSERYNGPGDAADTGTAVAVDPQGNVIVTGYSVGSNDSRDFYTACYNGRTGARIWFERFDGPGNREEVPGVRGLALGPQNSVAIAGATQMTTGPLAEYDMISILYTADVTDADGDGLPDSWEIIFWGTTIGHGPADDSDLDGVVELLEYGLGMDPTWPDAWRVPSPVIEGDFLTITLTKRPGVTLGADTSGTLLVGSWSAATTAVVSETAGTIKIRDIVPVSAGESRFLRTRVTAP